MRFCAVEGRRRGIDVMLNRMSILTSLALAIAPPAKATEVPFTTYIRCDDGRANPTRIGIALNEKANTASITEYYMEVAEVTAVSFGPSEVKFTVRFAPGAQKVFTVSRLDASVTSYDLTLKSTWKFQGCAIVEAPINRAF